MSSTRTLTVVALALAWTAVVAVRAAESDTAGAQYTQASWTEKDGLPSSYIHAMAQDKDGYLWLGTTEGLVRFDGVRFVRWRTHGEAPERSVDITALHIAQDGSLWVGFRGAGGVSRIHAGQVDHHSSRDGLPEGVVWAVHQDTAGTVWTGGHGGLSSLHDGRWERAKTSQGLLEQTVSSIYEDRSGNLWIATSSGIFVRRTPAGDVFEPFERLLDFITGFGEDSDGRVWAIDSTGAVAVIGQSRLADGPSAQSTGANDGQFLHDRRGDMWIATRGRGLLRMRYQKQTGTRVVGRLTREEGLTSDAVLSLLQDREGNIWVGTQVGLNRLSENRVTLVARREGLVSELVRAVTTTSDGSLWAGTANGVSRLRNGRWKSFGEAEGLPSDSVRAVHADETDNLWVGTERGPARLVGERFVPLVFSGGVRLNKVRAMTTDHEGGLWLCDLDRGIFRWKDGVLTALDGVLGLGHSPATAAYTDRNGRVWIGFADGAVAVYQNSTFQRYSERDGLAGGKVAAIYEDNSGTLWIGMNNGLSRFHNGQFATLRHQDGLPGHTLAAIVDDAEGYLWLGVSTGVVRLSREEFDRAVADSAHHLQYQIYDPSDGLSGSPLSIGHPTATRRDDGTVWFVTGSGLAVVNSLQSVEAALTVAVVIEGVRANDHASEPVPQLRLAPFTSKVQIDYTALSLTAPSKIRFRYKLEGFDRDWQEAGTRRQAFFTNLPPGSYSFRVTATNADGVWSESGASWDFSIAPMFYQTRWFYVVSAMLVALAIQTLWRLHLRRVRKDFALVLAERARMGREIHDTLLQGLVGVGLQFNAISQKIDSSPGAAKEQLTRARKQVESYIREAHQSIWDLRSPMLETHDLATALRAAAERITAGSAVDVAVMVTGPARRCPPRVEEHLLKVAQEALTNVVRHAEATHVRLELDYRQGSVLLRVSDDGCGFDPDSPIVKVPSSWGLTSMRERAQQLGGQLTLVSAPGKGTALEIVVPSMSRG